MVKASLAQKAWDALNTGLPWTRVRSIVGSHSTYLKRHGLDPEELLAEIPGYVFQKMTKMKSRAKTSLSGMIAVAIRNHIYDRAKTVKQQRHREGISALEKAETIDSLVLTTRAQESSEGEVKLREIWRKTRRSLDPLERRFVLLYLRRLHEVSIRSGEKRSREGAQSISLVSIYRNLMGPEHVHSNNDSMRAKRLWAQTIQKIRREAGIVPESPLYVGPHLNSTTLGRFSRRLSSPKRPKKHPPKKTT